MTIKNLRFTNFPVIEDWYGTGYVEADTKVAEYVADQIPERLKDSVMVDFALLPKSELRSEIGIRELTEEEKEKERALADLLREQE